MFHYYSVFKISQNVDIIVYRELGIKDVHVAEYVCVVEGKNGGFVILYHGSNVEIRKPQIIKSRSLLDFGTGFYLTGDYGQAGRWAVRTANRRGEGRPAISLFDVEMAEIKKLKFLAFERADSSWLRYVSANRTGQSTEISYDVVFGPVANDQAIRTINDYLEGRFTEDIAIQLLLPQRLKDQYVFKTEKAVSILTFKEARYV